MAKRCLKRRKGDVQWETVIWLTVAIAALAFLLRLFLGNIFPTATGVS